MESSPALIVSIFMLAIFAQAAGLLLILAAVHIVSAADQPKGLLAWRQALLARLRGVGLGRKPIRVGLTLWLASFALCAVAVALDRL